MVSVLLLDSFYLCGSGALCTLSRTSQKRISNSQQQERAPGGAVEIVKSELSRGRVEMEKLEWSTDVLAVCQWCGITAMAVNGISGEG